MELGETTVSTDETYSVQRDEIKFYMEKGFQASFGYFAVLVAAFALGNSSYTTQLATYIGIKIQDLLVIFFLLTNLFYLIVLPSCLFAILKRGLFILSNDQRGADYDWEIFARDPSRFTAVAWDKENWLAWNIDNFFMMPAFFVIVMLSIIGILIGIKSDVWYVRLITAGIFILPVWVIVYLWKLNSECQRLAHKRRQTDATPK